MFPGPIQICLLGYKVSRTLAVEWLVQMKLTMHQPHSFSRVNSALRKAGMIMKRGKEVDSAVTFTSQEKKLPESILSDGMRKFTIVFSHLWNVKVKSKTVMTIHAVKTGSRLRHIA